jgi:hypothetical protein
MNNRGLVRLRRMQTHAGKGESMKNEDIEQTEVDALCRECGHAFKAHIDRIIPADNKREKSEPINCPVCGCGECRIGK